MKLSDLELHAFERSWSGSLTAATIWLPSFDGSFDSRVVQIRGRDLLAAFILVTCREYGLFANMEAVRILIDSEMSKPGVVLAQLLNDNAKEVQDISNSCIAARGCWFGDAVPFLALNITDERIKIVINSWPSLRRNLVG